MAKQSYKQLKQELDLVIDKMQHPDTGLDEALELHAEGKKLLSKLEAYLEEVEQKVAAATNE